MTIKEIINKCGGIQFVAQSLGVKEMTVIRWLVTGIPWKYWEDLRKLNKRVKSDDILSANLKTRDNESR